jgi:outer membrane receptor protein involved in Fe transport
VAPVETQWPFAKLVGRREGMKRQFSLAVLLVFLICALSAHAARGQAVYGSMIGTVTDPQGAAVVGAKVTVTSVTKGTSDEVTTNDSGFYTVTHLIPDKYSIKVEAPGFKTYSVASVDVSADTAAHVDVQMQVGEVTQQVEVSGEVPELKTDRADVSVEFNQRYTSDLPILNRNFTSFELLSPGTQKLIGWSHAATENPQGGQQIFVNGQHFSGTAFELDGTDNQDAILGIIVVNPNLDAIEETKITLQDYDAEFGKATAGLVTVQTKSGTNELHGGGFFDSRDSAQEARDPFTNAPGVPLPNATYKDFGADVGGPIIKDKLFFFGDYQGTRETSGTTQQQTIPTALVQSTCNPAKNMTGFCDLSQYLGVVNGGGQVYNPTTGNPLNGSGRTAFPGNLIPIRMISPQAANILAAFPAPTNGNVINNFVGTGSGTYSQNAFDTRIDYYAPHDYHVFGRFSLDYFHLDGLGSLGELGGAGFGPGGLNGESTVHNYSLASGFDKTISPTLLTDFRFGYFKYHPLTAYSDANVNKMSAFGVPGLNLGTTETGGLSAMQATVNGTNNNNPGSSIQQEGLPNFGDGLNIGRCNCPLIESEQQFQFVNNWTKIHGGHTIKFGADIRYAMNLRVPSDANRTGQLNFDQYGTASSQLGGLALATFLLGDVTGFNRFVSTSTSAAERQWRTFFYGEDSWRVTSKFTFNYGLRWEIYQPEYVNAKGNGGFANLTQGVIRVAGYGPIGLNGNINNDFKAFAPRLGMAYQVNTKTVVRLGYGRSFDIGVFGSNFGHVVTQNLPVLANQQLQDSNLNTAATNNTSPVFTLTSGPPASLLPSTYLGKVLSEISPGGTLPLLGPDGTSSSRIRPTKQVLPTVDAWNATVQRQVTATLALEVAYIGNKGTHVFNIAGPSYNNNEVAVGAGTDLVTSKSCPSAASCSYAGFTPFVPAANRRPYFLNGVPAFTYPGYTTPTGAPLTCCAVDLTYFGNNASSNYNAIQAKVEKRFSQGLQFLAHYTFSHANAYDTSYYSINPKIAYGPDQYNRDHVFVVSTVYQLPFGRGRKYMNGVSRPMDFLIGGWQVANTLTWGSGLPWTATIGECGQIADAGPCRPNLVPGQSFNVGPRRINGVWYDFQPVAALSLPTPTPAMIGTDGCSVARPVSGYFALPACGQIGNAGFDTFFGPSSFFDDFSLVKAFPIKERLTAEFRFDAYNFFNHPVLGFNSNQGNTCIDCAAGGQITDIEGDASPGAPNGMRQLQFGLRVVF